MMMVRQPSVELLELFFQEVGSYLPQIRQGLDTLAAETQTTAALEELHRIFHNIKGASSQVRLDGLSRGAKVIETLLSELVERKEPIKMQLISALREAVVLLEELLTKQEMQLEDGDIFSARITELFADFDTSHIDDNDESAGDRGHYLSNDSNLQQECNLAIRSVLPLLQELAGCLSPDQADREKNVKIYGKLSQAVLTLAVANRDAGLVQQFELLKNFHFLLEKLRSGASSHLSEIPGLIEDFLQFLTVAYTYADTENSTAFIRVKEQMYGLHALLTTPELDESPGDLAEISAGSFDKDMFVSLQSSEESEMFLEELSDSLLVDEEIELSGQLPEAPEEISQELLPPQVEDEEEEALSEDQRILLEIFKSECEEHLIVINHSLNTLENEVKESCPLSHDLLETISVMRRSVHTLKGAAAMTGMNLTAKGAHSLEDLLDWLHDDAKEITPKEVQIIATGVDVIELLSQSNQTDESVHLDRIIKTIAEHLSLHAPPMPLEVFPSEEFAESIALDDGVDEETVVEPVADTEAFPEPEISTPLPMESGILRVKVDDLDELVGIEGELVVARGAMEKMLEEFTGTLLELDTVKENLRRKSQELESGFEVQSLYGFNPRADAQTTGTEFSEFDPIELDRYSQLNLIIRSLNEISVDVNSIHATLASLAGDISGQIGKQQLTMRLMQEKLMRIRMTPMSSLSRVLFRTVRETAKKLEKKANLVITGEDVYMDRFVWAKITDPLMHMLRNALDHGIEFPEQRLAAGKPESGTVRVAAEQRSRFVVLRISDDGAGIDIERIRESVKSGGLADNPEALSENDLLEFLFHPSFTTRQDVSTISGRGIGLDVVRKNIQDLRGSVQILNNPLQGVTFEIRIPFTLSVNRAIMVSVAGRVFAVPLQDIHQVKRFALNELEERDGIFVRQANEDVSNCQSWILFTTGKNGKKLLDKSGRRFSNSFQKRREAPRCVH